MSRPIAIDLFCCAGGAADGLARAGFEVVGVDIAPQPNYPYEFHQGDALTFPLDRADFVWASPPCQRYSAATRQSGNPDDHPDLVAATRAKLDAWDGPYVIENVPGAPVRRDLMLCGSMFGLRVVRHRYFELSGFEAPALQHKHRGSIVTGEYVTVAGNGGVPAWTLKERERRGMPRHIPGEMTLDNWISAMGVERPMSRREIAEAIPPAYAEYIGRHARAALRYGPGHAHDPRDRTPDVRKTR